MDIKKILLEHDFIIFLYGVWETLNACLSVNGNVNKSPGGANIAYKSSHSSALSSLTVPTHSERSASGSLPTPRSEDEILSSSHLKAFTLSELKNATRNFRTDHLIGEGGFGYVYKGSIDEHTLGAARAGSGMVVAVKKLKPNGLQGHKEWLFSFDTEFLKSYASETGSARSLSWAIRIRIAIDAARGLSILHNSEEQVIYRDFKASNILLDSEFNAKLSDFGLAKAGPTGDRTHVSTQVMGTQGYAAPEYMATGRLTAKCDVYSFGVVLLELLSGRRAVDKTKVGVEQYLVDWAKPYLSNRRKLFRVMDTKLEGQYSQRGALRVAVLALQCISEAKHRPNMSEVLQALEQVSTSRKARSPSHPQHSLSQSPVPKSPLKHSCHPSPVNMSPRAPYMKTPLVKFPQGRFAENGGGGGLPAQEGTLM
ncbi:Protein kinase 2B [Morus notabilis]|uniref:Protein kinase 2B n=1 Tax=Morus notabilis TaxID=981085 RepID=W9RI58_9ROSA|nr:Protein kinase 2B [Morus notabilis]